MKLSTSLLGLSSLLCFSLVQAQAPVACPTATRTIQPADCRKQCPLSDCKFQTTIRNPCNCPPSIPRETVIVPCNAPCPYQGCDIQFQTSALPCPTSTRRTTSTTRRTTSTTSRPPITTQTVVVTSIVTLPRPTTTSLPCPTVTRVTTPGDCPVIRCPVPTCAVTSTLSVPCNCVPKTLLWVQGCPTGCPGGCLARTVTSSATRC